MFGCAIIAFMVLLILRNVIWCFVAKYLFWCSGILFYDCGIWFYFSRILFYFAKFFISTKIYFVSVSFYLRNIQKDEVSLKKEEIKFPVETRLIASLQIHLQKSTKSKINYRKLTNLSLDSNHPLQIFKS